MCITPGNSNSGDNGQLVLFVGATNVGGFGIQLPMLRAFTGAFSDSQLRLVSITQLFTGLAGCVSQCSASTPASGTMGGVVAIARVCMGLCYFCCVPL